MLPWPPPPGLFMPIGGGNNWVPLQNPGALDDGTLSPEFDTLEQDFRELERKVRQRDCAHETEVDVTALGGPIESICVTCGRRVPDAEGLNAHGPR